MAGPGPITRGQTRPLGVATAFLGFFVIGSLAVQLVTTAQRPGTAAAPVAPVVAHQATLWQALGER